MILISITLEEFFEKITSIMSSEVSKVQFNNLMTDNRPVTTKEVCKFLGITAPTLIRWKKKGKIPFIQVGNSVRFDLQKVIAALEKK